ncbi:MAG: rod shape-determining protein MreD, partial [Candidatus Aminicenantes bacterium]|nr:rod shape-determining protein MreD [Candidatus Aminicenantes bacterium]
MRDIIRISIGLILAVVMYTLLESISFSAVLIFNIFNLVVIYFAMEKGETSGAILGMVCGMIQDSFSAGVFGVAGISKTITGFLAG